jgi:hypothetical protein
MLSVWPQTVGCRSRKDSELFAVSYQVLSQRFSRVFLAFLPPKVTYWHVCTDAVGYRRTWKSLDMRFSWNLTIVPDTGQRKGYFQDGCYLIACSKRKSNCDDNVACCGQSQTRVAFVSCVLVSAALWPVLGTVRMQLLIVWSYYNTNTLLIMPGSVVR